MAIVASHAANYADSYLPGSLLSPSFTYPLKASIDLPQLRPANPAQLSLSPIASQTFHLMLPQIEGHTL